MGWLTHTSSQSYLIGKTVFVNLTVIKILLICASVCQAVEKWTVWKNGVPDCAPVPIPKRRGKSKALGNTYYKIPHTSYVTV